MPTWLDPEDRFFRSSLLRATSDDRVPRINLNNDRSLNLLLSDCNDPIEENTLGTFGSLLETSCGRSMIGLPEWKEWGETAFPPAALKEFIVERWDQ